MIVKAIVVPTPRRIKKFIKDKATKERICLYSLIGTGVGIVSFTEMPIKEFVIGTLIYYGLAYEVVLNSEDVLSDPMFIEAYRNNFHMNIHAPMRSF